MARRPRQSGPKTQQAMQALNVDDADEDEDNDQMRVHRPRTRGLSPPGSINPPMASIPHWILTYPTLMATSVSSVFPVKKYYYQKSRDEARPSSTSTLSARSAQREKSKSFRGPVDPSFVDENKFAGEYGPLCRKFLLTLDTERYRLSSRSGASPFVLLSLSALGA